MAVRPNALAVLLACATLVVLVPSADAETNGCPAGVWTWQHPSPTGNHVHGTFGFATDDVWAVGESENVLHYDGSSWQIVDVGGGSIHTLYDVWGSSPSDLFIVGAHGLIYHYDGSNWTLQASGTTLTLRGIAGTGPSDVYAVGSSGTILHYDGVSWSPMLSKTSEELHDVWANGPMDIWACGNRGRILHYNGTEWRTTVIGNLESLTGVWGLNTASVFVVGTGGEFHRWDGANWSQGPNIGLDSTFKIWGEAPNDLFVVGESGAVYRFDGLQWTFLDSDSDQPLRDVWGATSNDVWAVGYSGAIVHFDGSTWTNVSTRYPTDLESVWAGSPTDVFAVGRGGRILRFDGTTWSAMVSGTTDWFWDVHGRAADDVYAVAGTVVYHYDGTAWTPVTPFNVRIFRSVWVFPNRVYAVGQDGLAMREIGGGWQFMTTGTTTDLFAVWGTNGNNVWAVGAQGRVMHYDGTSWTPAPAVTIQTLYGLWGFGANDIWAAGDHVVIHYDGSAWSTVDDAIPGFYYDVWGTAPGDVYFVGRFITHFDGTGWDTTGQSLTIEYKKAMGGSSNCDVFAVGRDGIILHLGEMESVPTFVSFVDAVPIGNGIELSWDITSDDVVRGFHVYRRRAREAERRVNAATIDPAARTFTDDSVQPGIRYEYVIGVLLADGREVRSQRVAAEAPAPPLALGQNHPNPFNPTTRIPFSLDENTHVRLSIYDAGGRRVITLIDRPMIAGVHDAEWDGTDGGGRRVASGVYFFRLTCGNRTLTRKAVLLK